MRIKMKRFLSILLSLALVLGLIPGMSLTAYADGTTPVASVTPSGGTATNYTDFEAALNNWTNGSTLKLLADVTTTSQINVQNKDVTLDLNGFGVLYT